MLVHELWSPGHLTVRTIRTRRGHTVEVLRDRVPLAEADEEGFLRATDGLVLAEALLVRGDPGAHGAVTGAVSRPASPAGRRATPQRGGLWNDDAPPAADPPPTPPGVLASTAAPAPPSPRGGATVVPDAGLTVDVFGVRQGEVRVTAAVERLRGRSLRADLLVDGGVAARLRTLGPRAEEAIVVAGDRELARLARFDHLRGVRRTVSSWDFGFAEIADQRLKAVTVAALLRLPALRAAATGRDRRR